MYEKLTKSGLELKETTDQDLIKKTITASIGKLDLSGLIGLAQNPVLSSDQIDLLFIVLKNHNARSKIELAKGSRSANTAMQKRIAIRKYLTIHPNVSVDLLEKLLLSKTLMKAALSNPTITDDFILKYFDQQCLNPDGGYNMIQLGYIFSNVLDISENVFKELYSRLEKYADWDYKDNKWYSVIKSMLDNKNCPESILIEVAGKSNFEKTSGVYSWGEGFVYIAADHKNSSDDVRSAAYKNTGLDKFLPEIAKEIFLF